MQVSFATNLSSSVIFIVIKISVISSGNQCRAMVRDFAASSLERIPRYNSCMDFFFGPTTTDTLCWPSSLSEKLLSVVTLFGSHYLHTTIASKCQCAVLLPSEPASKREKI
jgi:hypothetical protein